MVEDANEPHSKHSLMKRILYMKRVAQSVPAASCGSVPLPSGTPGGTPGELAGEDACATSSLIHVANGFGEFSR